MTDSQSPALRERVLALRRLTSLFRLRPFDGATAQGRGHERDRRAVLTFMSTMAARGIAVAVNLALVPLALHHLGVERYGLWMTLNSVIAMLCFADLGIGNGLLNALAAANGRDDRTSAREYTSSALITLCGVALTLGIAFAVIYPAVSWASLLGIGSRQAAAEAGPAIVILGAFFLVNMPLGMVQRAYSAYQEGYWMSIWAGLGSLLGFAVFLVAVRAGANLPLLLLAVGSGTVVSSALAGVHLFGFRKPWLRPRLADATRTAAGHVLRLGLLFLTLQVAVSVAYASDNLIAASVLGLESVPQYSVPFTLFNVPAMFVTLMLAPLWPAYGEAIARRDTAWVRRTLKKSLYLSIVASGLASFALVTAGKPILAVWVGRGIEPTWALLFGLGVWLVVSSAGNAGAMLLNGANVVRFQACCAVLMAGAAVVLKIILTRWFGVAGIVWGTVIAYVTFAGVPYVMYIPRLLKSLERRVA